MRSLHDEAPHSPLVLWRISVRSVAVRGSWILRSRTGATNACPNSRKKRTDY
jgi:hypothetical protein